MPGRQLIQQTAIRETGTMGAYKLTYLGAAKDPALSHKAGFRNGSSSTGRRYHNDHRNVVQPSKTSLESPDLELFTEDARSSGNIASTASTRSSNSTATTTSDDDSALQREFGRVNTINELVHARHSTACCTDLALRRELRKKFNVEPQTANDSALRDSTFSMGHSFRRELEKEDRVESLALWEEAHMQSRYDAPHKVSPSPHSWHGDTAASSASSKLKGRDKGLDNILRKKNKSSSFFSGLFSSLSLSSSRRSRKS